MHYLSTRGHQAASSFSDILLGGLAPDGGLYLPSHYPQVSSAELDQWRDLSYAGLSIEILKKFATELPPFDIYPFSSTHLSVPTKKEGYK